MIFLFCVVSYDRTQERCSNLLFYRIVVAKTGSHFSLNACLFCRIVVAKTGSHFSLNALKNGQSPHLGLWPGIAESTP